MSATFDPYAILDALERARVAYVVIGGLARVLHGADEVTREVDICPSGREADLRRIERALVELGVEAPADLAAAAAETRTAALETAHGRLNLVFQPAGTRGWDDVRRRANREAIGHGIRVPVASVNDCVRMLAAEETPEAAVRMAVMQRIAEVERSRGIGR